MSGRCGKGMAREADLLPLQYFHLVFTLNESIASIAHRNKRELYNLLMRAGADPVVKMAADLKHLRAHVGSASMIRAWGTASQKNLFLPVHMLSHLYLRLILE